MADLLSQLRTALADRYTLERELGCGGMATVYLARDLRHKRPVALKVLHPELAYAIGGDRFLREIEVAANLTHPHIVPLFDSGEVDGLLYYVMPYIAGESLRDRLAGCPQLPLEEAVHIAENVASALAYAHGQGIVHRDIKPENILFESGEAVVTDFGIAKAVSAAGGDRLTEPGAAVGTVAYMSPEQSSGQPNLDGRADVYSLGCVLYEMLAGELPYDGPTPHSIIAKRASDPVPSVRRLRLTVPEALDQVVTRALAPVPADRFATAADFQRALLPDATDTAPARMPPPRRLRPALLAGSAVALAAVAVVGALLWQRSPETALPGRPARLAVLPFENLGDSADGYFADGMSDAVRGKLIALPTLQVIDRRSSTEYRGSKKSLKQIGGELGVEYLLTATVRWDRRGAANRVQVSPELVYIPTASTRWQQPFDAALTDVFQVQSQIAQQVAEALEVALGPKEKRGLAEPPTRNLAAYDAYLKAAAIRSGSGPAMLRRAAGYLEEAVTLDSTFAVAWAALSTVRTDLYFNSAPSAAAAEAARRAGERAVALAPDLPAGHSALGHYFLYIDDNPDRALEEYRILQRIAPNSFEALAGSVEIARNHGRLEAALTHQRRLRIINPRSPALASNLTETLLWLRRYPEAQEAADYALQLAPTSLDNLENKAMVHLAQGDLPGARAVVRSAPREIESTALIAFFAAYWDLWWVLDDSQQQTLLRLTPEAFDDNRPIWGLSLTETHALLGDEAKTRAYADSTRMAAEVELKQAPEDEQLHLVHGLALAYLGRKDDAVREGEKGLALSPYTGDRFRPYYKHLLARIYILTGRFDQALDEVESLLKAPYFLSPGWLSIDPAFDPLRHHPGFQRLVDERFLPPETH